MSESTRKEKLLSEKIIGCGTTTCHGHGDYSVCGKPGYGNPDLCPKCEGILTGYRKALNAMNVDRDNILDLLEELSPILWGLDYEGEGEAVDTILKRFKKVDCPECRGLGEVFKTGPDGAILTWTGKACPVCKGRGFFWRESDAL